jgi:hypothetical protein
LNEGVENGKRRKSHMAEGVEKYEFGFIILDSQWLIYLGSSIINSENKKYLKGMTDLYLANNTKIDDSCLQSS